MATSFSGGRSQSTWREPPTMGKQLVNFITCGCESSAPFFVIYKARAQTHAVLVLGLYELLVNYLTHWVIRPSPVHLSMTKVCICNSSYNLSYYQYNYSLIITAVWLIHFWKSYCPFSLTIFHHKFIHTHSSTFYLEDTKCLSQKIKRIWEETFVFASNITFNIYFPL
jgi:hypothetical protein